MPQAQLSENKPSGALRPLALPLTVLIIGAFMVMFDSTAMNILAARLIVQFHSSYPVVQWVITGYLLAEAAVIPLTGWLCDRFGTKRVFLAAVSLFTLGSFLCALAWGIPSLVAFRVVQGLGGGMVIPIMFAYTYRISPPERIGKVMGIIVVPILLAPALGPVMSGMIVDHISWHWIFAVNLPIGAIVWALGIRKLPAVEKQPVAKLDAAGMLLAPVAFAGLCYGISESATDWHSVRPLGGIGVGLFLLIVFALLELRREAPLLELRVFKTRGFPRTIAVLWIAAFVQFGSLFLVPQALQNARGYGAFDAGTIMLPYVLFAGLSNQLGGRLFDKRGVRPVALTGFAVLALGMFLMSRLNERTDTWIVILIMIVIGASVGFCVMPLTTQLLKLSPARLTGRVTSLSSAIQQVIVSLAVSSLAALTASRHEAYADAVSPPGAAWSASFRDAFLALAGLALLGWLSSFSLPSGPASAPESSPDQGIPGSSETRELG